MNVRVCERKYRNNNDIKELVRGCSVGRGGVGTILRYGENALTLNVCRRRTGDTVGRDEVGVPSVQECPQIWGYKYKDIDLLMKLFILKNI